MPVGQDLEGDLLDALQQSRKDKKMIQYRNMWKQVLLFVVTLGFYGDYWFYVTSKEMLAYKKLDGSPGLWTVLFLIPVANLYAYWKYSKVIDAVTDGKYQTILIFILWIFFAPAVWYLTQTELNKLATQPSETTPTTEVQPAPSEPTSEEGGGDGEAGAEAP